MARDEDRKTPLDEAKNRETRRAMKDAVREKSYHELLQKSGGVKVNRCKVFVFGMAETGKSTLKKSLRRGPVSALFQGLSKSSSQEEPHDPTPGVDVGTFHIPGVGEVSLWDFAGQAEYAVTHSMFMDAENTVFIVLYNIMDDSEEQERQVHWWLSFIKSCNPNRQPDVILVASHADKVSRDRGQRQATHLLQLMTSEFKDHLRISDEVFLMNCKETRTADMDRLKKLLTKLNKAMLEHQQQMPKLCAEITKQLPSWCQKKCSPKCPVLRWPGYVEAVKEIDPHVEEEFLLKSTRFLDHLGEAIFSCPKSIDPIIVLKPNWLCTDVIGPMMAPVNFPIPRPERTSEDYVTRAEIQRVFQDVADVDLLITLLQEFQLCHSYDGQTFIFPGLLTQTMPPDKWQLTQEPNVVYFGKQVQCADSTDMFSSGFFPRVQTRLMRELENPPLLWRDGAKCADRNVEGLIKLSPDGRAVNICVRSAQGDKVQCGKMLQQLENIIADVLDECSPGTGTVEKVLSARALKEHMEEFYSYGKEEISEAAVEGGTIVHPTLGFTERVSDLLCVEEEDPRLQGLVNYYDTVINEASNDWDLLALKLGFNDNEIGVIRDLERDQDSRCREMLTRWKDREGREATLQVLKEALKEIGQVRVAEILDVDVKDYFDTVIKEASNDWDELALELGFNYNEIGVIRDLKPDQDRRCREMLHRWRNREGSGATPQVLKQALIEIDQGRVAERFTLGQVSGYKQHQRLREQLPDPQWLQRSAGLANVCAVAGREEMDLDTFYRAVQEGDVQTVRRGLEAGVDVNVKRKWKGWPDKSALHLACWRGQTEVAELLIKHGSDLEAINVLNETPLHDAARWGHTDTCELLIGSGANIENREKQVTQEKKYHELLQKSGGVKVNRCKVVLGGRENAGKSTLKASFTKRPVIARLGSLGKMSSVEEPYDPTPGVDVGNVSIPGVGQVSLWDFAGQAEYAVTHSMFMDARYTIFIVLYNIMDDSEEQERQLHWWLSFIKSCNPNRQPDVILVASHADQLQVRDRGQRQAAHLLHLMTSEFKDHLHISDEVFLMNCKETLTPEMDRLKKLLASMRTEMFERQRQMPKLCGEITKHLFSCCKKKCSPKCPVLRWPDYVEAVKEIDPHVDEEFLLKSTRHLHRLGEVIFSCPSASDPIIVLKPNWLCTDVIGPMMAPVNFPIPRPERTSEDYVTRAEIQRVFQDVADVDLLITLLQEFQLCHSYDGQTFIFPGLLTQTMPPDKWQPTLEPKVVYFGKQVQCADSTDMFSSGFFPRVQIRLMRELENRPLLWRDGAKCADRNVEGLIKLSPDGRTVNICVRSAQGDKVQCGKMLQQLENTIADVLDECSPGTGTVEKVLSARALKEHMGEFYSYGKEEISKAAAEGGTILHPTLGYTEQVSDLLCGEDEDPRLQGLVNYFDAVINEASNEWDELALKLGFNDNEIGVIRDLERDQDSRCREMLTRWKGREGREATLQVLKEALKEIGHVRVAEILDVDVKDYFDTVIKEASNDWDELALELGFNYNEIGVIRDLKPDQDRRCREMLHRWRNREGSGATPQVLKQALIEIDQGRVAESFME
ncbi:uncharacterized protein LOC118417377 [Branchiostoma floridae]|uniref:Uncharacterized protein LOC118417377 n=1 Tax=Branchiostoma floridae TaxID=7739 RepID=A0A9J7LBE2_BRAFL|nr:uncharacterized protein LOC118417377 [Branchiostoma floridae]